jgi:hypothetical protein
MTSGSEKRVRGRILTIRLADDELASIEAAAERAGLMTGSYARQALLGAPAPRQVRRPAVERKELVRLLGELGKVGGLLNQLARTANQGITLYEGEVLAAVAKLKPVRDAILTALGREP